MSNKGGLSLTMGRGDTIYAVLGQFSFHARSYLTRSTDAGLTWDTVATAEGGSYISLDELSIQSDNLFLYQSHYYDGLFSVCFSVNRLKE